MVLAALCSGLPTGMNSLIRNNEDNFLKHHHVYIGSRDKYYANHNNALHKLNHSCLSRIDTWMPATVTY